MLKVKGVFLMKSFTKFIAISLLFITITFNLTGCGNNPKKDIIGKWKVVSCEVDPSVKTDESNMFEALQCVSLSLLFNTGSTVEFVNKEKVSLMSISANYKWINDNKMEIILNSSEANSMAFDVTIKGNQLILKNSMTITLEKVK